jgi:uncharacterized Zn finger protein (UPF0148 family)
MSGSMKMPNNKATCAKCGTVFAGWDFIFCPRCGDTPFHEKYPDPPKFISVKEEIEKKQRTIRGFQIPEEVRNMKW